MNDRNVGPTTPSARQLLDPVSAVLGLCSSLGRMRGAQPKTRLRRPCSCPPHAYVPCLLGTRIFVLLGPRLALPVRQFFLLGEQQFFKLQDSSQSQELTQAISDTCSLQRASVNFPLMVDISHHNVSYAVNTSPVPDLFPALSSFRKGENSSPLVESSTPNRCCWWF